MNEILNFFEEFIYTWSELWTTANTPLATLVNNLPQAWRIALYIAWAPLYFIKDLTLMNLITTHISVLVIVITIVKIFKLVNPMD